MERVRKSRARAWVRNRGEKEDAEEDGNSDGPWRMLPLEWRNSCLVISFFMSLPVLSTHANRCARCSEL